MKKTGLLLLFITLASLAHVPAAQPRQARVVEHFSKDGLSFDYPSGWSLAESDEAQVQHLTLTRPGLSTVVLVFAHREPIKTSEQLYAARARVTATYVENLALKIGLDRPPPPDEAQCINAGGGSAVGFRMAGRIASEPTTAEVYSLVLNQRLIHLVYVRNDKDEAQGAAAWKSVLDTLKVEPPPTPSPAAEKIDDIIAGGVLNRKALKKPPPEYPDTAKAARVQGTVVIQILVNENGEVVSAQAVSGPQLLRAPSEKAARRATFTPTTLCGRPAKVTGVITYNFVLM